MMWRVVLDTNVVVSALLWGGPPGQVFEAARSERLVAILTEALLSETVRVLSRPKFRQRVVAHGVQIEQIREQYRLSSEMVEAAAVPEGVVRDPKDALVLGCAVGGRADYIVSGDKDLLTLGRYEHANILTPDTFLRLLSEK